MSEYKQVIMALIEHKFTNQYRKLMLQKETENWWPSLKIHENCNIVNKKKEKKRNQNPLKQVCIHCHIQTKFTFCTERITCTVSLFSKIARANPFLSLLLHYAIQLVYSLNCFRICIRLHKWLQGGHDFSKCRP